MPFTAPTAANISSCLVISAAKSLPLSSYTSIQAGVSILFTSQFYKWRTVIWVPDSLSFCCKQLSVACHIPSFVCWPPCKSGRFVLPGHLLSHIPSLRWPQSTRLKQSLVPRLSFYFAPLVETAQSSGFTSQPFKDVLQSRPPLVSRHAITFANSQQHACMAARLLPPHLFSARRSLPVTHIRQQRPSNTKTPHNVTRLTIQTSC